MQLAFHFAIISMLAPYWLLITTGCSTPYPVQTLRITLLRRQLLSIIIFTLRTTRLDGPLVSYLHMPACQQPAGPHPQCLALGRQQGRMQQGRSQPGTSRRRSKTAAAGCGPAAYGPAMPCFLPEARHCGCGPDGCWHAGMSR